MTAWSVVRFLHVLGAAGWVGGQLALSTVVVPAVRTSVPSPHLRAGLMRDTGRRFAFLANAVLLPMLVATGIALAVHRHIDFGDLGSSTYGKLLATKLTLVVLSIALAGVHGVAARRNPTLSRPLAIAGLVAAISILLFATALVP